MERSSDGRDSEMVMIARSLPGTRDCREGPVSLVLFRRRPAKMGTDLQCPFLGESSCSGLQQQIVGY